MSRGFRGDFEQFWHGWFVSRPYLITDTVTSFPDHVRLILEILNLITQTNHIALDHWSLLYQLHKKVFKVTPNCSKSPVVQSYPGTHITSYLILHKIPQQCCPPQDQWNHLDHQKPITIQNKMINAIFCICLSIMPHWKLQMRQHTTRPKVQSGGSRAIMGLQ